MPSLDRRLEVAHIDILLARYFSGETDASETSEVEAWRAAAGENREYMAQLEIIWKVSKGIEKEGRPDVQAALGRLRGRLGKKPVAWMRYWWAVAAAASVIVIVNVLKKGNFQKHQTALPELVTRRAASQEQIDSLPDGSVAVLGPHAELVYPAVFSANRRDVQLKGDAFFSVLHDNSRPFRIMVKDLTITVLGTSFIVKDSAGGTTIAVRTGAVEVTRKERRIQLSFHEKLIVSEEGPWVKIPDSVPLHIIRHSHAAKNKPVQPKRDYQYYRHTMRSILDELVTEGVVSDRDSIGWAALTDSLLIVNGIMQPDRLHEKLRAKYLPEPGAGYFYGQVQITGMGYFFDKKDINP